MGMNFGRPFGTLLFNSPLLPTLKRWAIVVRSLRDGTPDVYPIGYNHPLVIPMPRCFRHSVVPLLSRTQVAGQYRFHTPTRVEDCHLVGSGAQGVTSVPRSR